MNGDYLQVLARLGHDDRRPRASSSGRVASPTRTSTKSCPAVTACPSGKWDFTAHTGDQHLRLRDHGNELVVGLVLQFANEHRWQSPRAEKWRPTIARMLDRILASANPDGLLYDEVDAAHAEAVDDAPLRQLGLRLRRGLHLLPVHRRDEVSRRRVAVLRNLPKYRSTSGNRGRKMPTCRSDPSMATPTPSRARIYLVTASPCRKRSTGSNPRCR